MKTQVRIQTQYFENKAWYDGGTAWSPKGGHEFTLMADTDLFMYAETECIEAIRMMLAERSNKCVKFTYLSHELIFDKPEELANTTFEKLVQENYEKSQKAKSSN